MVVIYMAVITAIILNKNKNYQIYKSYKNEKENIAKIEEQKIATEKQEILSKLPNLTEEGLKNIKNIYKSETHKAYLTFDDGPSSNITNKVLDILKQENVKATFFVLGSRVELNPNIVKRAFKEGHYIANHGYSHIYSQIYNSSQTILDEYNKTEQAIKDAIEIEEYSSHLFRFPGGSSGGYYSKLKEETKKVLNENNIAYIDWNALTGDTEGLQTKEDMLNRLKETVGNKKNVVVLMHDGGDKKLTYEVLPEVIDYLREKGYEFDNFYSLIK